MRQTLGARIRSFGHAFRGLGEMLRGEVHARVHALATCVVVVVGLVLRVSREEWLALVLAIALVWVAEAVNTALEALCDVVAPAPHPGIRRAKDVAAGAVLIAAFGATGVAGIVFGPRLLALTAG